MEKKSWFQILISFASICKSKMILAVLFAIISVFGGIIPFFGVYKLLDEIIKGSIDVSLLTFWCCICAGGFLVQILCYAISTTFLLIPFWSRSESKWQIALCARH